MMEHTPGPWRHVRQRATDDSHDIMAGNPAVCVATCGCQSCDDGEIAANARLIAAAPKLLKACEAAESYYARLPQCPDRGHDVVAELADLRAAIAKTKE